MVCSMETPLAVSMPFGADLPPYGGDTIRCNTVLAYDYSSDTTKQIPAPLKVHVSAAAVFVNLRPEARQKQRRTIRPDIAA